MATREETAIDYVFRLVDIPIVYYLIAAALYIVVWGISKAWYLGLLAAYLFLVLSTTLLVRTSFIGEHFQPELFWSWKVWSVQKQQILANVVMFIPIGCLLGRRIGWKSVAAAAGMSVVIEIMQLVTARGLCEFDDIVHNTLGAAIGFGIVMVIKKIHLSNHRL